MFAELMSESEKLPSGVVTGNEPVLGPHLRALGRLFVVLGVVGVLFAVWRWSGDTRRPGRPEANVAALVKRQHGLVVSPESVQIPAGLPRASTGVFGYRDVFFLARKGPSAPRDVYWLSVRFTPAGVPLASRALVNLSRTPAIDEPTLLASGPYLAFVIPAGQQLGAVVVVDTRGDHARVLASKPPLRRLTNNFTNLQESGHWRGYSRHGLEPRKPVREITLTWEAPGRLAVTARSGEQTLAAALDCQSGKLVRGATWMVHQPPMKGDKPLFNWLVDTVRRMPGVGPKKIEWMQVALYTLVDLFRRRVRKVGKGVTEPGPKTGDTDAVAMAHDLHRPRAGSVKASHWPPAPLKPLIAKAPANEGKWFAPPRSLIKMNPGAPVPVLETFIHPDPRRPYSAVGVLIWDPRQVELGFVAGTREPESSTGLRGWGRIPRDPKLGRVIAAFNGGFQTMHGEWGMKARGRLIREPMKWAATVATDRSGRLLFGTWERSDKKVPPELVSFRQNLAPLIEDGVVNPLKNRYWGLAVRSQRERIYIVRSGICFTKEGYGAYLWGKALSLETLTQAMKIARCQYGMQLDINRTNASLEWYRMVPRSTVKGDPPRRIARGGRKSWGLVPGAKDWVFYAQSWLPGMYTRPFPRFIRRDWRDFFYLSLRSVLPGSNLRPVAAPPREGEGVWSVSGLPQGTEPFPPRIATTFIRPDAGRPEAVVQIVKLDPRRLSYRAASGSGSTPVVPRAVATLMFGSYSPPGLVVRGKTLVAPSPQSPALLVERGPLEEDAPRARLGTPASTPKGHLQLLVIGGGGLGAADPPAPASASSASSPSPAPAGVAKGPRRASGLGVDGAGTVCYAVTAAGEGAGRLLAKALAMAGCAKGVRLPDRPGRGPLVLGPVNGRVQLLRGDGATSDASGHVVGISWATYAYSKRLMVGVAQRPKRVQFSISRKEQRRLYRQRMQRDQGAMTPQ
jgi:hypothetical protein